jgi:hypothetical protein
LTGVVRTDRGQFVSPGFFGGGRLGVFDADGKLMQIRGQIPQTDRDTPPVVRQHMFQATATAHPKHHMLAVASRYASRLEIFSSDGELVALGEAPVQVVPEARVVKNQTRFVETGETTFGYIDVAASGDLVFALFSGRNSTEYEGREYLGQEVHVFGWDGTFRGRVHLEADAFSLTVDESGRNLYAAEHEPVPMISHYDLTGLIATAPQ